MVYIILEFSYRRLLKAGWYYVVDTLMNFNDMVYFQFWFMCN